MVYDWELHQQTCYQLYIVEGKSLEDIMDHMKSAHGFAPSKRAFQTQFRRWNFPSKQNPAYKNERLVDRIKELWEQNLAQRDMLRVLNEEDGFDIKARELMRVRTRNRWLLRIPNGDKSKDSSPAEEDGSARDETSEAESMRHEATMPTHDPAVLSASPDENMNVSGLSDGAVKNSTSKKRKRAKTADAASGHLTRFPSEMTIDEARLILNLDASAYRNLRSLFQHICQEGGVLKKTVAGSEKWEAVKTQLIQELPELQAVAWALRDSSDSKKLALDVICTDVTKRMRNMETRMTLAEAKNALHINPEESREVRLAFHQVLSDAQFTCKSDATTKQWEDLKRRWGGKSQLIGDIIAEIGSDQDTHVKGRALEVLARDVMKRLREDRGRKAGGKKVHHRERRGDDKRTSSPGVDLAAGQASASVDQVELRGGMTHSNFDEMSEVSHASQIAFSPSDESMSGHLPIPLQSQAPAIQGPRERIPQPARVLGSSLASGMPLDPQMESSMLLATNDQASFMGQAYVQQPFAGHASSTPVYNTVQPLSTACAAYLRLHPSSGLLPAGNLWIATINSQSLQSVRQTAAEKFPGTVCVRVEGILKDGKGGELPLQIEQDQELGAYLAHLQGGTPTFNVQLVWKTS